MAILKYREFTILTEADCGAINRRKNPVQVRGRAGFNYGFYPTVTCAETAIDDWWTRNAGLLPVPAAAMLLLSPLQARAAATCLAAAQMGEGSAKVSFGDPERATGNGINVFEMPGRTARTVSIVKVEAFRVVACELHEDVAAFCAAYSIEK